MVASNLSGKRVIPKIIHKELIQLNSKNKQKTPTIWVKNKQRIWIDIFPKRTWKWLDRHMKRCSISLIRKMQIKTTWGIISHLSEWLYQKTSVGKHMEKRGSLWTLIRMLTGITIIRVWSCLKKIQNKLPYDLAILPLCIYLKKIKTLNWKDICTCIFTAALFVIAKIWTQRKCPLNNERISKMWYTYMHTENDYSAIKWMKLWHLWQHE